MSKRTTNIARACLLALVALTAAVASAATARADFGIKPGSFKALMRNSDGSEYTQAAGHPYDAHFEFSMNTTFDEFGETPDGLLRDTRVDLPEGFIGNPQAVAECAPALLATPLGGNENFACPAASQVGTGTVFLRFGVVEIPWEAPIFNMKPSDDEPAYFAFNIAGVIITLSPELRPDARYSLRVNGKVNSTLRLYRAEVTLWGNPADPGHDGQRFGGGSSVLAPSAFLTGPSDCEAGPLSATLGVDSYENPGAFLSESAIFSSGTTGCDRLRFEPTIGVQPETTQAGAPSGYRIDLDVPQPEVPNGLATPNLRDAVVKLPAGATISPPSADGLAGCSDAQIGLGTNDHPTCPPASKIGELSLTTPLLPDDLKGDVYLAQQHSDQLVRLYLVMQGHGMTIKLSGDVDPDPITGQLTASFEDNPSLPFSRLSVRLKGGPRAAIVNPPTCGPAVTSAELTAYGISEPATPSSTFQVTGPCAGGFAPKLQAGVADATAGRPSAFELRVIRADNEENISRIDATLPEGLLAKLAGVPLCPDGAAPSGSCPAASQIGTTTVGVGAGSNPLYVPQAGKAPTAVYLAGPYKGAPYSLVVKVPAQAGPFDLGTVNVRSAISVDPTTAQVSVRSDPLPQILQGIPLAYRDVRVAIDRGGFTLNPTSCDPMEVKGTIGSNTGKSANVSSRFQVTNCAALAFKPSLKLKVTGPTKRGTYPKLRAELKAPAGQANIGKVSVALPHSEFLAQEHIKTICTRVQYAANGGGGKACPAGSVYGWARAFTPLLDKPLEGPVYLRSSSNPLPDLVASLDGQIHIDLTGRIDSVNGGIRNTFESVPDAPVSKFVLTMKGGKKSLLVNSRNLCAGANRATVKMDGQNGKVHDFNPVVGNSCGKKAKKK